MPIARPTQDLKLSITQDHSGVVTDLALTPGGDLAVVADVAKLQQDVLRWILTPQGNNPFDPTWGNSVWDLVGRPGMDPTQIATLLVQEAQLYVQQQQAYTAALGALSTAEQLASIDEIDVQVASGSSVGLLTVSYTVVTRAGTNVRTSVPLNLSSVV